AGAAASHRWVARPGWVSPLPTAGRLASSRAPPTTSSPSSTPRRACARCRSGWPRPSPRRPRSPRRGAGWHAPNPGRWRARPPPPRAPTRASAASPGSWPSCGADPPDGTPDRSPFALSEPRSTFALTRVERGRAADAADERTRKVEPMDLYRTDDSYVAMIDMPGMTPSSIEVDVDGTVMTVRAERARPAE